MKIYKAEKSIAHLLNSTVGRRSIGVLMPLSTKKVDKTDELVSKVIATASADSIELLANQDHPDLLYGSAILVSTVMNLNDDVFLPSETWKARATPIHTPFNDNHVQQDVIGHIYDARPLDQDGKLITATEAPDYFDIEVDWAVYRSIFPTAAAEIEDGGLTGEKFVSMEAIMNDFDYALVDDEGMKVVARNEETAFLTKHLRAYRGSGQYNGVTVGRVLRNFRFNGMGSVDVPANPGSKFTEINSFTNVEASDLESLINTKSRKVFTMKENVMFETLEQAVAAYNELKKDLENVKTERSESAMNELKAEVEAAKAEASAAKDALEIEKSKVETAEQALSESKTKAEELESAKEEAEKALEEAQAKLDEINAEKALAGRLEILAELGINPNEERKAAIAKMSEEDFQSLVDWTKEVKSMEHEMKNEDKKGKDGKDKKEDKMKDKSKAQELAEEKEAAEAELEGAEEEDDSAAGEVQGEEEDKSIATVAARLVEQLRASRKTNKDDK